MANISVTVQDANNIILELTPVPTQNITIDRGIAGNGIESISVVTIDGDQYLHIVFTDGTESDVGPISATSYTGVSPISVNNTTNQISLSTVPLTSGGTGATTASAARTNLGLGSAALLSAGVANGAATLDSGGTVPISQLPSAVIGGVSYQGSWDASTNTPTLVSSVGTKGYYYVVSVAGSTNLNGITDWLVGDWAIFNGTVWQKIDNTDAVVSVNGYTGTVVLTNADISGFGTMSTQNANAVAITGGTATLTSLTTATVQATNSGGLSLKNSAGTTQISMGGGGGDNVSINVSTNINGSNAQVDISPTGTGHVHIKPTGSGSIEVAPTSLGTIDNMTIGGITAAAATVTTLTATSDSAFTSTGAVQLSSGTTAQRPTGAAGKLRFNTTTTEFEGYNGTAWASVGGSAISNDTSTSTNLYPLFASATTGTAANVYTSNAQYLFKPSTGELSVKAPVAANGIFVNSATVSSDYTIPSGSNGFSVGPITVNSGVTVTVPSGQSWVTI